MDFSSQLLRGEKVVWSAALEKAAHDATDTASAADQGKQTENVRHSG